MNNLPIIIPLTYAYSRQIIFKKLFYLLLWLTIQAVDTRSFPVYWIFKFTKPNSLLFVLHEIRINVRTVNFYK